MRIKAFYHALGRGRFFEFIFFSAFIIFFFGPLTNTLMIAFADSYNYAESPHFLPSALSLKWWKFVLTQKNLVSAIVLSFFVATVTTSASLLICLPAAYAFARFDFPLKHFFQFSFLFANAFPRMGLYVSIAIIFYKLNLMGTFAGVVFIHLLNTLMYMTWIPAAAFRNVHIHQEEAARDVGATAFQTFRHITLPLAMPGIMVACIFTFLQSMEEAQGTFLIGVPNVKTIPVIMYGVIYDYPGTAGAVFAIILVLPTLILLGIFRRFAGADALTAGFKMK
ncbi:MAG: ABC transporter permease subunit [Spirochaetaceae bacterium]|nr:ABC transporter permease subunit [Spirochaetaceae bacterium]